MKNISNDIERLYNLQKEVFKLSSKDRIKCDEYCKSIYFEKHELISKIDEFLIRNDNYTFPEEFFRIFWQCGFVGRWYICKTKDKYISTISKYVELYGTPLEKETIMYKAVRENEDLFGGSWSKDLKSALNFSVKFGISKVVSMVIPKGTKSIHIHANFIFTESEDLIDTTSVINETLDDYAKIMYREMGKDKGPKVKGVFENLTNGCQFAHYLNNEDSDFALWKMQGYLKAA